MIHDLDICRSANVLILEHGEDAALEAAMREFSNSSKSTK